MNFQCVTDLLEQLPKEHVPGTDCVIYYKGQAVYRHLTGYSDIEAKKAMEPGLLFHQYSATKPVTCAAALQLYEKGLYGLSDPLYAYMPEFKHMYIKNGTDLIPAKRPITIRDLFTMCAGMDYNIRSQAIANVKRETSQTVPTMALVRALAEEPLSFEPGTRWQYGLCHDVLGGLIEVVSGQTLGAYCKAHIFEPLGMQTATYMPSAATEALMAPLYMYQPEQERAVKISNHNVFRFGSLYESGGAGLIASADDYIRFAQMLTCGGKSAAGELILSRGTIELMRTNQLAPSVLPSFNWPQMAGYGYGLGVRVMMDRQKCGSVGSVGEFGWGGAAGAYLLADPEAELAAYFTQHMLGGTEDYTYPELRNRIYEAIQS